MSIKAQAELLGMQRVSEAVGITLKEMREHARPGMTTKELDDFGAKILSSFGARSAPSLAYGFPGCTCISINHEIAHGVPSNSKVLREGDLVNIDVSAELDGYWSDNGGSFVAGKDINNYLPLVNASKQILQKALSQIRGGIKIGIIGRLIETEAKKHGYKVIRNLAGHGIGRKLHEEPREILNYYDRFNNGYFKKNSVVAVETFISTTSTVAETSNDGWTLKGNRGGFVAQHEHTIMVTNDVPLILTETNGILN